MNKNDLEKKNYNKIEYCLGNVSVMVATWQPSDVQKHYGTG